jgi:uncharacterized repeat protein (TIGR02543 family)
MKHRLYAILALVLALGLSMSLGGCPAPDDGADDTGLVAMTDGGTTTICDRNIPRGGVTGGTDHGFCSSDPEEQDEWHFVLIGLNASAVPGGITAVFVEDTVVIGLEKYVGAVAHYRLPGYLNATLVGACAQVEDDEGVLFLLSHAPCGETQPVSYDLTTSSTDGGSVTVPGEGVFTYDAGTVVDLVATPETGYRFSHWSGDVSGTSSSTSVTMNGDKSVTASFVRQYTLSMAASPAGAGTTGPGVGSHVYDEGTEVDLSAAAGAGYRFSHWSGDVSGTSSSTSVTMNGDKSVTASFVRQYTLSMAASPAGAGTTGPGVGSHVYDEGTEVDLSAAAGAGYRFSHWSGDAGGTSTSTTVTMDGNKSVMANFVRQYTLTMVASPAGVGTTSPGAGSHVYDEGTEVDLSAAAGAGYRFSHWSGDAGGTSTSTAVTMGDDKSVTANFVRQYTLTMVASPAGVGTTSPGAGSHVYDAGTVVSLSAIANPGYRFDRWLGDASGTSPSTTVTMDSDRIVSASFVGQQYTLTVAVSPSGAGTTIPGVGSHVYDAGVVVDLSAVANTGYRFSHWSGDVGGTSTLTTVTMDSDKSVTANFVRQYTLTMAVTAGGGGTTSPGVGSHTYDAGTVVSLGATANPGYQFSHWSGHAGGTSTSTTVTMDSDKSVTASFAKIQYTLTMAVSPGGGGATSPIAGSHIYDAGMVVNLSATAAGGYEFSGWSGDVSGTSTSAVVTMDGNKSVTASFAIKQYTLTYSAGAVGSISGTTPQTVSHGGSGTAVTAVPDAGYNFVGWSDGSTQNPRTDTNVTADITVTASFAIKQYTLTYSAGAGGNISGTTPQTVSHGGSGTAVTAVPDAGYNFVGWSDGSTQNPRTDTNVTGDKSVTASFAVTQYTYKLTVSCTEGGSATATYNPTTLIGSGETRTISDLAEGMVVDVAASAAPGHRFVNWSGDVGGIADTSVPSISIVMDGDYSITASFEPIRYSLTVSSTAGGYVSIPGEGTFTYDAGTVVALRAIAYAGYLFSHWSGDVTGTSESATVTMSSSRSVRAHFAEIPLPPPPPPAPPPPSYTLTISSTPGGSVTVPGEGTFTYERGTVVNLVAEPAEGYRFVEWVGDVETIALVNAASTTITIEGNHEVVARFERGVGGPAVRIAGVTRGVDGAVLPGADVVLYHNGEAVANTVSDEIGHYYALVTSGPGSYDVTVSKDGFQNEARPISVSALTTSVLDFVGDYGLVPRVPSTPYVLACMSLWKLGEPPLQLSTSKMLQVVSAWLYG